MLDALVGCVRTRALSPSRVSLSPTLVSLCATLDVSSLLYALVAGVCVCVCVCLRARALSLSRISTTLLEYCSLIFTQKKQTPIAALVWHKKQKNYLYIA
jgi:hypothetical protein